VLLHQGPADREAVDRVATTLELPLPRLIEPPLPCLAAVLAEAAAYLGGDSGVSHLAASVGAPGVMLFPAATRERWAPWSPTARPVATDEPAAAPEPVAGILVEALGRRGRPGGPPACTAA
jgi:ADP-heptose:LPS heptosyltransferase